MKLSISMTRRETLLGWSYLLISMFVLSFAFSFVNSLLPSPLSDTLLNLIYFALNFLSAVVIFHRFLGVSVKAALATPWRCLRFAALGFFLYYLSVTLLGQVTIRLYPDFINVNDTSISQLSKEHYTLWALATVWLVPISEELFYRGLVFQGLQREHRMLAYLVSTLVFACIHVMGYVGLYDWLTLSLCFVQYLPAGLTLAWAYEKADTVAAPILMHITINQIGISALR